MSTALWDTCSLESQPQGKNPELESLRQFAAAPSVVLAAPATLCDGSKGTAALIGTVSLGRRTSWATVVVLHTTLPWIVPCRRHSSFTDDHQGESLLCYVIDQWI